MIRSNFNSSLNPSLNVSMTTGIGSLPHHNIDAALAFSFKLGIPFLPQIPLRNPWEFMIAQSLEGLPGLEVEKDGAVSLDMNVWKGRSHALNERLLSAFSSMARHDAFEAFEPSSATSSSWDPFLWELEERGVKRAKIQLAGPLTSQWALKIKGEDTSISKNADLASQVYRLVLARALAMSRRLKACGIQPILYLDEPGLFGFLAMDPKHALGFQELKILIQALRNEGVLVGLHCCSNTHWAAVLGLGLNIISIDTDLSLKPVLAQKQVLDSFLETGGILSLGVIPTSNVTERDLMSLDPKKMAVQLLETLENELGKGSSKVRNLLSQAIFTPACGLALHSISAAELILSALLEFEKSIKESFRL